MAGGGDDDGEEMVTKPFKFVTGEGRNIYRKYQD